MELNKFSICKLSSLFRIAQFSSLRANSACDMRIMSHVAGGDLIENITSV